MRMTAGMRGSSPEVTAKELEREAAVSRALANNLRQPLL